jgi:tRNA modification GTPase
MRELFRPFSGSGKGLPLDPGTSHVWLGRLGEHGKGATDEVVVAVRQTAPLPWVELHCHGGIETVRWLTEILAARGCRACSWQEFEHATSANPWRPAVVEELVRASTLRTATILLDQYHGAFTDAIREIRTALDRKDRAEAERLLKELARYANVGRHLTTPWKVAVIGAPNVGKSSLVNALAGFQRSVVAATPGTTRDVVTTLIAVDGWLIELADTAGLREETEILEGQGIALARRAAASADLCLWVLDASVPPVWPETRGSRIEDRGSIQSKTMLDPQSSILDSRIRMVINKIDLPPAWDLGRASGALGVSALTRAGLGDLLEALSRWLVPDVPAAGAAVPFTPALAQGVEEASRLCQEDRMDEVHEILTKLRP